MGDLIEARRAEAETNDAKVLRALAGAGDVGASTVELAAVTGLSERTVRAAVARLVGHRLAVRAGQRGRVFTTPAGRAEAGAGMPGLALVGALDGAVGLLPSEGHRAFTRLLLSGVVARWHLRSRWRSGWGCFVVVGPTKTAKTAVAELACQALGLASSVAIRSLRGETEAALVGRRERIEGRFRLVASELLGLPLLCLDEFDKAPGELRTATSKLLQGDAEIAGEGTQVLDVAPCVMVCANSPAGLRGEYLRRAVVLDTEPLLPLLGDVHESVRQVLAGGAVPRLDSTRCGPRSSSSPTSYAEPCSTSSARPSPRPVGASSTSGPSSAWPSAERRSPVSMSSRPRWPRPRTT